MKDDKTFGQRLREARVAAGLSQSDLEDLSGIPKARLSRYENGHVVPSIQTLERLASALKVSEATLLGDQRAVLETFFNRLYDRGVRIDTPQQGERLADAIADLFDSVRADTNPNAAAPDGDAETERPRASSEVGGLGGWVAGVATDV